MVAVAGFSGVPANTLHDSHNIYGFYVLWRCAWLRIHSCGGTRKNNILTISHT